MTNEWCYRLWFKDQKLFSIHRLKDDHPVFAYWFGIGGIDSEPVSSTDLDYFNDSTILWMKEWKGNSFIYFGKPGADSLHLGAFATIWHFLFIARNGKSTLHE